MTNAKLALFWNEKEYEIKVNDGNLIVENNIFSIPNEKIKYFYYNRYQSGGLTILYYLTETGNIYITKILSSDNIKILNNFKKLNYSNVTDIIVIPNDNYGNSDEISGMTDNVKEYLYVLKDDKIYKLEYQYAK